MKDKKQLPEKNPLEVMSTIELGEIVGVSSRTVQRWCEAGDLKHKLLGRQYVVLWQDFVSFWTENKK